MVIERYFESPINDIPRDPNKISAFSYRFINSSDYSLTKYSVKHYADFVRGIQGLVNMFTGEEVPKMLQVLLDRLQMLINKPVIKDFLLEGSASDLSLVNVLKVAYFFRRHYKNETFELINIFSRLDAYNGMALACKKFNLVFPAFEKKSSPFVTTESLFHLLLPTPVAYDLELDHEQNFLFLTGANMAGKSTFIKAVGVAVYLAHVGMGVPAKKFRLSLFDGLLSNIQVEDNILKGESYFFNEVKRVKKTIEKINDGRNWLILIDELFKGTNVQDAMKCSVTVIEGLRKLNNALFILSTHLYEIGEGLKQYPSIKFSYFETHVNDGQLVFNYTLKDGISNDRLGYLILKREGVVEMLDKL
jgi:DNA mismatch repair ATPase MutS